MEVSVPGSGFIWQYLGLYAEGEAGCTRSRTVFRKTLSATHTQAPRIINVDKNAAYPKAVDDLKSEEVLPAAVELRQNKYLNSRIEQDHRFIKRLVNPGMGFQSFNTARRTIKGYEVMNMLRKGQVEGVAKRDIRAQVEFVSQIFGIAS